MNIDYLKMRKENFGWLLCDTRTCSVYEISDFTAQVVKNLCKHTSNKEKIDSIAQNMDLDVSISTDRFEKVLHLLKIEGIIDDTI
jgi:hypothetical protein